MRPDQLDQQVALAINQIRRNTRDARHRLGLDDVLYETATAETVVRRSRCKTCNGRGYGRHTIAGPIVDCPDCSSESPGTLLCGCDCHHLGRTQDEPCGRCRLAHSLRDTRIRKH